MVTNEELSKRTGQPNDVAFYQQHKESCDRLMEATRVHERDIIAGREEIHEKYHELKEEIHEKYHELNDKEIEIKAYSGGYKEGQKDASKEILDFDDKWNTGINTDDLDQKEIDRYYKEKQELLKKYNYEL